MFALGFGPTALGVVVLQHEYTQNADETSVTDGMVAGPAIPFDTAELFDSSGYDPDVSHTAGVIPTAKRISAPFQKAPQGPVQHLAQRAWGPTLTYALEGHSLPAVGFQNNGVSVTLTPAEVPDWDGIGIRSGGRYLRPLLWRPIGRARADPRLHGLHPTQSTAGREPDAQRSEQQADALQRGTSGGLVRLHRRRSEICSSGFDATLDIQFGNQERN